MTVDVTERMVKGKIAEVLIEHAFRDMGFLVCHLGKEYMTIPTTQMEYFTKAFKDDFSFTDLGDNADFLKTLPDFVIIHKSGKRRVVEVRYRWNGDLNEKDFKLLNKYKHSQMVVINSKFEIIDKVKSISVPDKEKLKNSRINVWFYIYNASEKLHVLTFTDWLAQDFGIQNPSSEGQGCRLTEYEALITRWLTVPNGVQVNQIKKNGNIDLDAPKTLTRLQKIHTAHPSAHEPWDDELENRLKELFLENKPIKEIAQVMGRQPSAIRARLLRLGIVK
ncbi:sigma-70 region 4 domain-containing protein [Candidatus Woesearchaeota archaeon]|nr:sigma-70 region 4 domain-containing protein [Candidatus Woesearchaeota archaeon]